VKGLETVSAYGFPQTLYFCEREIIALLFGRLGKIYRIGDVAGHYPPPHRLLERRVEDVVDVLHRARKLLVRLGVVERLQALGSFTSDHLRPRISCGLAPQSAESRK